MRRALCRMAMLAGLGLAVASAGLAAIAATDLSYRGLQSMQASDAILGIRLFAGTCLVGLGVFGLGLSGLPR